MLKGNFNGLCVLALESRRAAEIARLVANYGGRPLVAPSVREVSLESNREALAFVERLRAGEIDMVIFLTGVGVRTLALAVESACTREQLAALLNQVTIVARGPKPVAALRELSVRVSLTVPEPNTWRDLLSLLDQKREECPLDGRCVAVQEYGISNPELCAGLEERGARVRPVPVYQWALPEDIGPLREAIRSILCGEVQMMLVTSAVQVRHLFQVAQSMASQDTLREALSRVVIASIGPLTSEELQSCGLSVDFQCTHPKLGFLVQEAAEQSVRLIERKKAQQPESSA